MQNLTQVSTQAPEKALTIVLGVIGADCHAVGNKIIMSVLGQLGFNVINLGVMVSQEEFIDAAIETGADAILVSSIYGHGEIDCLGFRGHCVERGLEDIVLYVGGNLVIGKRPFADVESRFIDMGFDRVFAPSVDLHEMAEQLTNDIALREPTQKVPSASLAYQIHASGVQVSQSNGSTLVN